MRVILMIIIQSNMPTPVSQRLRNVSFGVNIALCSGLRPRAYRPMFIDKKQVFTSGFAGHCRFFFAPPSLPLRMNRLAFLPSSVETRHSPNKFDLVFLLLAQQGSSEFDIVFACASVRARHYAVPRSLSLQSRANSPLFDIQLVAQQGSSLRLLE